MHTASLPHHASTVGLHVSPEADLDPRRAGSRLICSVPQHSAIERAQKSIICRTKEAAGRPHGTEAGADSFPAPRTTKPLSLQKQINT